LIIFISNLDIFPFISPHDIVSITQLIIILKIITHCANELIFTKKILPGPIFPIAKEEIQIYINVHLIPIDTPTFLTTPFFKVKNSNKITFLLFTSSHFHDFKIIVTVFCSKQESNMIVIFHMEKVASRNIGVLM